MTDPTFLSRIYRGYAVTPLGRLIGLAWAWLDGVVWGVLFAWFYNRCLTPKSSRLEL